ncbi:hypothetical protein Moror_2670 [Moniliophthora roreri MCA 2997]|uniref:Uncharacterized protein n=1 Tax=Moniliophthora roreri (strain MCA 2997) TaxID=1381753 RepID=V2XF26_MONRO|nr:hypothetical protein Moror_2670 [Moniliophthora roreri MCA 2997]
MPFQSYSPIPNDTYANFETYFERQSPRHDSSSSSTITPPVRARTASQSNADRVIRHSSNSSESKSLSTHTLSSESDSPKGFAMDRPDSPDPGHSAVETIPLYSNPILSAGAISNHNATFNPPRLASSRIFISSPLNPSSPLSQSKSPPDSPYGKVFDSFGRAAVTRRPSEEARALGHRPRSSTSSMILYRLVDTSDDGDLPSPPRFGDVRSNRSSISSLSGDTVVSVSYDSKYPSGPFGSSVGGIVAYAYDPTLDTEDLEDEWNKEDLEVGSRGVSRRGLRNVTALSIVILLAIGLFLVVPLTWRRHDYRNDLITHNPFINSTGQAEGNIVHHHRRAAEPSFTLVCHFPRQDQVS